MKLDRVHTLKGGGIAIHQEESRFCFNFKAIGTFV
jgi:hypothetical protein